jgi:hypothetical protein
MGCAMIKIRYRDPNELSPGLHAAAERHGRSTTVYLLPGLSSAQRHAALRRLKISARRGYDPRLPAPQLAVALVADRIRTTVGRAGNVFRSHPAGSTVPVMVVSAGAIAFLALSAVSIRVTHTTPRVPGPVFSGAAGPAASAGPGPGPGPSSVPIAAGQGDPPGPPGSGTGPPGSGTGPPGSGTGPPGQAADGAAPAASGSATGAAANRGATGNQGGTTTGNQGGTTTGNQGGTTLTGGPVPTPAPAAGRASAAPAASWSPAAGPAASATTSKPSPTPTASKSGLCVNVGSLGLCV